MKNVIGYVVVVVLSPTGDEHARFFKGWRRLHYFEVYS
jgi:hypothetical protein